ncbi:BON domain-containing protein [Roseicella sp. DB1501]|uniref:BON domain-containing protein n=1 Tax=Roseicella sp. DB1501 TaxID=2730925 RepID=UPI0014918166|nr:BON domain-containing protein [Roseicella sp. DB1501]NOG69316.1 BON domain-containing protein [Roseicella sp. DB1501]
MPTYRFPAEAGLALEGGVLSADAIGNRLNSLGLTREGVTISRHDDAVTLEGRLPDEATRERVLLAVGNLQGIARVDDRMTVARDRGGLLDAIGSFARLPSGSANIEAAERAVHAAKPDPDARFGPGGSILHVVQPGETLEAIAARHYHDTAAAGWILESNDPVLTDAAALRPGMVLRLPPR